MKKHLLTLALASIALLPGCRKKQHKPHSDNIVIEEESETLVFEGSTEGTERISGPVQEEVSFLEEELK